MKSADRILKAVSAGLIFLLSVQAANAQQACRVRTEAVVQLERQYDEQVAGRGLAANGQRMLELFVSETGSWTLLVSDPSGRSCVVASGEAWQGLTLALGDPA